MFRKRTTSKRIFRFRIRYLGDDDFYEYCKLLCDYAALFEGIWTFSRTNARNGLGRYILVGIVPFNILKGYICQRCFLSLTRQVITVVIEKRR